MEQEVFLNKERVPIFIGKQGNVKHTLEKKFNCSIDVNSQTGRVLIRTDDGLKLFILEQIIRATNLGHNPQHTMLLEDEHNVLDCIDVKSLVRNPKRIPVVLGRIIGKGGATRKVIEEISGCYVSVQDTFVSTIGPYENILLVHEALEMLISGASHKSFYGFLERNKKRGESGLL